MNADALRGALTGNDTRRPTVEGLAWSDADVREFLRGLSGPALKMWVDRIVAELVDREVGGDVNPHFLHAAIDRIGADLMRASERRAMALSDAAQSPHGVSGPTS